MENVEILSTQSIQTKQKKVNNLKIKKPCQGNFNRK